MRSALLAAALAATLLAAPRGSAQAQRGELDLHQASSQDLYLRRRPALPESRRTPPALERLLGQRERQVEARRRQAIALLRQFLAGRPAGDSRAEGLFKLAELLWEDQRHTYVRRMADHERAIEACRQKRPSCTRAPVEPRLDFSEAEALYRTLLRDHPEFRRRDLVLYLVAFAAREAGRAAEALELFAEVTRRYPDSPLYADAWMMLGEHHFMAGQWTEARNAFARVLERRDAKSYDVALFKTAWCDWKLGETQRAARRFKEVLDLASDQSGDASAAERKRRSALREEALDYLVLVFTEDERVTPPEVHQFLASIGGERYSREVLGRLAELFFSQASYERSAATFEFLIGLAPGALHAARYQRRIVDAHTSALDLEAAARAIDTLLERYGPASPWARDNRQHGRALHRSLETSEKLVRGLAKNYHAEAQQAERRAGRAQPALYQRAAGLYERYLRAFGRHPRAPEVRFLRAEILFFKLGQPEAAGDEYLAVGKSRPIGRLHKDALLKAMAAYEKARPAQLGSGQRRELLPGDRKFAEATDLYATLFPADPALVGVIFRNGQMFYDYGAYDESVKRFGLIVTRYPDHPDAGAAGDRILDALARARDYENIEEWARKLKKARAFAARDQQSRLDRLIVESIGKSGEKYAQSGSYERAASFYLRIPREFPRHTMAAQALFNAAVMYEKARKPERAGDTYRAVADRYPASKVAEQSAFTAARVYESMAYFDRAAEAYEMVARRFSRSERGADALFNAGVLRQALGQHKAAIAHYQLYARRHRERKDAEEVAFRAGVVYEEAGDHRAAERALRAYTERYRSDGKFLVEAHVRAGRAALQAGQPRRAAAAFRSALGRHERLKGKERQEQRRWAAEARYQEGELIYREYDAIGLEVAPGKLRRTLERKTRLLEKAQAVYLEVVEYNDPQWATAALYRIGRVFEEFATALREAPTPPGLSSQETELYRQELDNHVIEIEEKAIQMYKVGYEKAFQLGVYNRFTRELRSSLGRLAASEYPPEKEAREGQRTGDRPLVPELIKEVVRDQAP